MMKISERPFGTTAGGIDVQAFTLTNDKGMEAEIITYGAVLRRLVVNGRDVLLGYDSLFEYEQNSGKMGAVCGRFANRIGGGAFTIDGETYKLPVNNGPNTLHGGVSGFDKKVWTPTVTDEGLQLTYVSADGEEGFPGELTASVTYSLTEDNELVLDYRATTTKTTALNLTNHSYFNLHGQDDGSILDHVLVIPAGEMLENDPDSLPTGRRLDVTDTPFDFRRARAIGEAIDADDYQITYGHGYDHCYIIAENLDLDHRLTACAVVSVPDLTMTVITDLPGFQLYTANHLGNLSGKDGALYRERAGVCFETQYWPDAVSHEDFPGGELRPGETFTSRTIYQFS